MIRRVAKMDDRSKSSMLQNFERGRTTTEVDDLCGEIVRLAGTAETTTYPGAPVNAALVRLVKSAARDADKGLLPCVTAAKLLLEVGLHERA